MPSGGITLTLEPWKVVSCGSLLTLLPLDIWKVLKPQKSTQVLRIEHHFVFYMISSFHQKSSDFYAFCYVVEILSSNSSLYTLPVHFHKSSSDQQGIYISCPSNPGLHWKKNGGFGKSFGAKEFWKSSFHHLMMVTGRDGHFVGLFRFEEQHEQQTFSEKHKERSEKLIATEW